MDEPQIGALGTNAQEASDYCQAFTDRVNRVKSQYLEMFAAAFLKETGLSPLECELVQEWQGNGIKFYFRKKS